MTWVAAGMTAAEIAAAEAAAVAAAEIAAAEAATAAATAAATDTALAAAPEVLAPTVTEAGITSITPPGAETLQFANAPTATSDLASYSQDRSILDMMNNFNANQPNVSSAQPLQLNATPQLNTPPQGITSVPSVEAGPYEFPSAEGIPTAQGPQTWADLPGASEGYSSTPQSNLGKGFNSALEWMDKNPFKTGLLGYTALNAMGAFDPNQAQLPDKKYSGSLNKYRMSPNFQPSRVTPIVYEPRYAAQGGIMMAAGGSYDDEAGNDVAGYAAGGIASYARGSRVSSQQELQDYLTMMEGQQARPAPDPEYVGKPGIMYDLDPDTRYKDALTASMIRMGKINSKANYEPYQNLKRPMTLGGIKLSAPGTKKESASSSDDEREAAAGGIMQADRYNMGGYASGSVPRLLKGPGDGMSDDIPASIDGRQPARLADGEFVIPADVVSGLGNGSTDAGAKHLHKMMTDVRKARTGNPKQGKQIVAQKYIPKKGKA